MGLQPGNRVLLRGPNTLQMAVAALAALKAGLVLVPTMPLLRAKELKQIIDKAQISAALCDARLTDELARCRDPQDEFFCPTLQADLACSITTHRTPSIRSPSTSRITSAPAIPPATTSA